MNKVKSYGFYLLMLIEVLVMTFFVVRLFLPKDTYVYNFGYNIKNAENYIENEEEGNISIFTDEVKLDFGRYIINCDYSADERVAYFKVNANKPIKFKAEVLFKETDSLSTELWVTKNGTTVDIELIAAKNKDIYIESFSITETNYFNYLSLIVLLIVCVATVLIKLVYDKRLVIKKENIITIAALLGITMVASIPLFADYLVIGHDTELQITRIEGIKEGLLSGQFPVRIDPLFNRGYGYAIPLFYGSLFLYIPAFMRILGFTLQFSFKFYVFLINLLTVCSAYYCIKRILKDYRWGIAGSAIFTLAAYRFTDLYVRGAVGQVTAWAFLPLIVAGLWNIYNQEEENKNLWLLPVIGYTGVIESHIISTEIYGIFTILFCLLLWKKTFTKKVFIPLVKVVVITVLVNLSFLIPLVMSMMREQIVITEYLEVTAGMQAYGVELKDLFSFFIPQFELADWRGREGYIGLGISMGLGMLVFIYAALKKYTKEIKNKTIFIVLVILTVFSIIISTNVFPWDLFINGLKGIHIHSLVDTLAIVIANAIANIQWPYRFLTVAIFLLTILICISLKLLKNVKVRNILVLAIISVTAVQFVISSIGAIKTANIYDRLYRISEYDEYYSTNIGLMEYYPTLDDGTPTYMDITDEQTYEAYNCTINDYDKEYNNITIEITQTEEGISKVELPLFYYNGYVIENLTTGEKQAAFASGSRRVMIISTQGTYKYRVSYEGSKLWRVSDIISILTVLSIISYISLKSCRSYKKTAVRRSNGI